ncbi:MAG: DUF2333 family protein [Oceanococcus sp.]
MLVKVLAFFQDLRESRKAMWTFSAGMLVLLLLIYGVWISSPPETPRYPEQRDDKVGVQTLDAALAVADALLDKRGGYISNDVTPPAWWLDNIKNWEFGVLKQLRDFNRVLRNEISRSQSQSAEDKLLSQAEPKFNIDNQKWMFPRAEAEYRAGADLLQSYRNGLSSGSGDAHFYANAENLVDWMAVVEKRVGSLVQRLGMSVGKMTVNDRSLSATATVSNDENFSESVEQTPWLEIDDVFFEARGTAWALLVLLDAAEADFSEVLGDKQARLQYRQVLRELESANKPLRTIMIMNGSGYSIFANHSLVMASYLGAANSALANLIGLLENG